MHLNQWYKEVQYNVLFFASLLKSLTVARGCVVKKRGSIVYNVSGPAQGVCEVCNRTGRRAERAPKRDL